MWNNSEMGFVGVQHYLVRAKDFYEAMTFFLNEPEHHNTTALLAIHSAISNSDALRLGLGDLHLGSEDHKAAADALLGQLRARRFDDLSGIAHLRYLLSMKTPVAYGAHKVDAKEARRLSQSAERFSRWTTRTGLRLNVEEWRNEHE